MLRLDALRRPFATLAAVLVLACLAAPSRGAAIGQDQLQRVMNATVYLKVDRLYRNQPVPTRGSGFFVTPRGHVVTNWHVVAPQVEIEAYGRATEVSTSLGRIEVVVASGTSAEQRLVGRILVLDRERDLALLSTDARPAAWLQPASDARVSVTDTVWTVGYPFGDLLALNKRNPEVTVTSGHITAMRHDAAGRLEALQIDAAVNPGNSGGPVLDERGQVVGVCRAGVSGGTGTALAISPNRLQEFLLQNQVRVRFEPDGLYKRSEPIRVRVGSLLRQVEGLRCRLSVSGSNIDAHEQELEWRGGEFDGLLTVPAPVPGSTNPAAYTLALALADPGGRVVWQHFYSLPVREEAAPSVGSARQPGAMMRDRYLFGNRTESSDVRDIDIKETEEPTTQPVEPRNILAELARDIQLRRPAGEEGVTISNRNLLSLGFLVDPAHYANIPEDMRDVATEYDQREYELRELRRSIDAINAARGYAVDRGSPGFFEDRQPSQEELDLAGAQVRYRRLDANQLVVRLNLLATRLAETRLCRCNDGAWHRQDDKPVCAPCTAPRPGSF